MKATITYEGAAAVGAPLHSLTTGDMFRDTDPSNPEEPCLYMIGERVLGGRRYYSLNSGKEYRFDSAKRVIPVKAVITFGDLT